MNLGILSKFTLKKAKPFNFLDALEKYKSVGIFMIYGVSR
jgi:hypothetical protein